jgi:hypothetical protein
VSRFSTTNVLQSGLAKPQYTRCESVTNGGFTCNNPIITYGTTTGGIPHQHSGNNFPRWCQQLGFAGFASVTYGTRDIAAPRGKLFGCTTYDDTVWHWCDWMDGYWYNGTLDYHSDGTQSITSITCN